MTSFNTVRKKRDSIIKPRLDEQRQTKDKLTLIHIITINKEDFKPMVNLMQYFDAQLKYDCEQFDIEYIQYDLHDENKDIIRNIIKRENTSPIINGIIYNYPFINNTDIELFENVINPNKDIGFVMGITSILFAGNYSIMEPHVKILKYVMDFNMYNNDMMSYSIITNNTSTSHRGFIPYNNFDYNKFTFINDLQNYTKTFNSDIVVSLLTDNTRLKTYNIFKRKYSPLIVLDFGWSNEVGLRKKHTKISLDYRFFTSDTPVYNWLNSLTLLYTYALINNILFK